MSIRVNTVINGEQEVVLGDREGRIVIHPWTAGEPQLYPRNRSEVYVGIGDLKKDGQPKYNKKTEEDKRFTNGIFDRSDFVEAILAVFPELVRR